MCCTVENNEEIGLEKKFRLADFFDCHWESYMESPTTFVKAEQLKAVNAMRVVVREIILVMLQLFVPLRAGMQV